MATTISNQFSFGSGFVYGIPVTGTGIQPILLGTLQDCTYDISSSIKELYGQLQFAAAVGRGPAKFTGKAKMGQFNATAWNIFFFGPGSDNSALPVTNVAAAIEVVDKEVGTTTTNAYQFTNHAIGTFVDDLGVYYNNSGAQPVGAYLQKVSSAPATGQYSVTVGTGTYNFAAGDSQANSASGITIAYSWQRTAGVKVVQQINNAAFPMGLAPVFEIVHHIPSIQYGTDVTFKIYSAMASKLALNWKNEDFTVPEIDFSMFANSAGKVIDIVTTY